MKKLSEIKETYFREEPASSETPKSDLMQMESLKNKEKKAEIIKAWTRIKEHPKAENMKSEVGSAFDECDLDEEMGAAFDVIGEGGMIYCSFEQSFWIRHKGQLIRVM